MFRLSRSLLRASLWLALLAAAGCSTLIAGQAQPASVDEEVTQPAPTATPNLVGYPNQPGRACLVAEVTSLRTDQMDNRTFAWSPEGDRLAYIGPTNEHGWYTGKLAVLSGADFSERLGLAEDANGSLTWSPDGEQIAFSSLRQQDKVMTVLLIPSGGGSARDLFPEAQAVTDEFSSPKTIAGWPDETRLYVRAICGDECAELFEINPTTGAAREVDASRYSGPRPRSYNEEDFPVMNAPAWSQDGSRVAYFDEDGGLWALSVDDHLATPIEYTGYTPVNIAVPSDQELGWSARGQLAARLDDRLLIYNFPCSGN